MIKYNHLVIMSNYLLIHLFQLCKHQVLEHLNLIKMIGIV